jgi:hypothetical protein
VVTQQQLQQQQRGDEAHMNPLATPFVPAPKGAPNGAAAAPPAASQNRVLCPVCGSSGFLSEYVLHAHLKAKHPNYTGPTNVPTASATADGENSPTHALAAGAAGNGTDVPDLATKHDPADDSASSRASSRTSHDAMGQLDRSVVAALLGIMVDNRFVSFSVDDLFMRLQQLPAAQLAPASPDNLLAALQRDGNFLVFTYSNDDLTAIANRAGVGLSHVTPRLGGRRIAVPGANHAAADATYFQKDAMQAGHAGPVLLNGS